MTNPTADRPLRLDYRRGQGSTVRRYLDADEVPQPGGIFLPIHEVHRAGLLGALAAKLELDGLDWFEAVHAWECEPAGGWYVRSLILGTVLDADL